LDAPLCIARPQGASPNQIQIYHEGFTVYGII